jgi:sugar-specific transcriptional regulator TrmB
MKHQPTDSSNLRHPLTSILGSKGHILILRVLIMTDQPMSHSELINRTSLSRQGVYDVVGRLIETGIVTLVGSGNRQHVLIRKNHPLFEVLASLFAAEKQHFETLLSELRNHILQINDYLDSAWIFGKAAQGTDEYGDALQIALLGNVKSIDSITNQYRQQLIRSNVESKFDVTIDLKGLTIAEVKSKPSMFDSKIIHLWGVDPSIYIKSDSNPSTKIVSHSDHDKRSLLESYWWIEMIKMYPEIIPRTVEWLTHSIAQSKTGEIMEWMEWKNLLTNSSSQRLKKFLESDSERSVRLRQSLPFWYVLTENERKTFNELKSGDADS